MKDYKLKLRNLRASPGIRLIKQASMPTSGVLQCLRIEDVARSWWGPSACRPNFLRCVTDYANLDD